MKRYAVRVVCLNQVYILGALPLASAHLLLGSEFESQIIPQIGCFFSSIDSVSKKYDNNKLSIST